MPNTKKSCGRSMRPIQKVTRARNSGRTDTTINDEHHKSLAEYSELSGVSIEDLMDECLEDYIFAVISTEKKYLTDQAANA